MDFDIRCVCPRAIRGRLQEIELRGSKARPKPLLTDFQRKRRLTWTREHSLWTIKYWEKHIQKIDLAVANSWFLCKQDAILNKIPLKIKMDGLKLKLEIVEALRGSPPTNKSILTDDEDNNVVIPLTKRSKGYNPPAIHVTTFILTIPE
ncbi:uncharacterized protein TNCV_2236471 [Trichonephila clavipes]|nr:uncharacterized protein TNCV_2236471 [Trichonephila clavipes]